MSNDCSVCGKALFGYAVTDPDGQLVVLDIYPLCEECLAEMLESGEVDISELI